MVEGSTLKQLADTYNARFVLSTPSQCQQSVLALRKTSRPAAGAEEKNADRKPHQKMQTAGGVMMSCKVTAE